MSKELTISNELLSVIKEEEGFRESAYRCPAGKWTIGYGFTKGVKKGDILSRQDADVRLSLEVDKFAQGVLKAIAGVKTSQSQYEGLVSFAYNVGIGNLLESTLLRKHRDGNFEGAAREFRRWVFAKNPVTGLNVKLKGLVERRAREEGLYRGLPASP